jgi:hypothetical protein
MYTFQNLWCIFAKLLYLSFWAKVKGKVDPITCNENTEGEKVE